MSIQPHSKESKCQLIFSVCEKGFSELQNETCSGLVTYNLIIEKIPFKILQGYYKGFKEISFLVASTKKLRELVVGLCKACNQESYLSLGKVQAHGIRKATLIYSDIEKEIGFFRSRRKEIALQQESYTYDPSTDTYFVVEKDYTEAVTMK